MTKLDMTEMYKLIEGLRIRELPFHVVPLFDGLQVVGYSKDESGHLERDWDAICHMGSYGREKGLIEIAGSICKDSEDVEGYLTAEDILARL